MCFFFCYLIHQNSNVVFDRLKKIKIKENKRIETHMNIYFTIEGRKEEKNEHIGGRGLCYYAISIDFQL